MAVSVRARFEVFKRDDFTCQYCGRRTPTVILEVDHIVPRADGGSDDIINLRTSCWECNSGKSDKPLSELVTGEDPHDRAVMLLERERQMREYNAVLQAIDARVDEDFYDLAEFWTDHCGKTIFPKEQVWLRNRLREYPTEAIRRAMCIAISNNKTYDFRYLGAILRNQRERGDI